MAFDTGQRFDDDFQTNIIDVYDYDVQFLSLNEDLELDDFGSGPVITVDLEIDNDELFGTEVGEVEYIEEGIFILSFFAAKGSGTREADIFYGRVRDQYRNTRLDPGVGEEGTIYLQEISRAPRAEFSNSGSSMDWVRYDVFIDFIKNYDV